MLLNKNGQESNIMFTIYEKIKEILLNHFDVDYEISMNTSLVEIGIDSIGFMALIVFLEESFNTLIDIELLNIDVDEIKIKDIVLLIGKE